MTVHEVEEKGGISKTTCHEIRTENLGMYRVTAKFVPCLLNEDQEQNCVVVSKQLVNGENADENFLKNIVPGDETWVYDYDVKTKAHSSQWFSNTSPRPKKAQQIRSNMKVMLTVFVCFEGEIHHEFLPLGQTVNKKYYSEGDEKAERGSEEKKALCEGENNDCSIMTMLRCISPF